MERRAVSEVAGTVILIGVVVMGMVIVNLVIFTQPNTTRIPRVEASMTNQSHLITIVHQGGDPLSTGQYQILVDGNDSTPFFTNSGGFGPTDLNWSIGETLTYNDPYMPHGAVLIYNGTGTGGIVLLQVNFPWGVGVIQPSGGYSGVNGTLSFPWFNCSWGYRKNITIDHTKVAGNLLNFPVLINLTDSDLATKALASGDDIFFTDSSGTYKIPHEIEYYSSGTLVAWVNVPSLSNVADTTIMMYYGNASFSGQQNPAGVWSNGYAGVWHLNNGFTDSTSYGNNGFDHLTTDAAGIIGRARYFDGSKPAWITVPDSPSLDITSQLTMEAWVNLTNTGKNPGNITKIVGRTDQGWVWGINSGYVLGSQDHGVPNIGLYPEIWNTTPAPNNDNNFNSGSFPQNSWTHLAVTWNTGDRMIGYVNGVQVNNIPNGNRPINASGGGNMRIGVSPWDNPQWNVTGLIEEVRISNVNRTPQWIQTEFANQNSPSTFISSVGTEVVAPCSGSQSGAQSGSQNPAVWDNCNWSYRRKITIDHNMVNGTLANFPVLISIASDSSLSAHAKASAGDIFFTDSAGNQIPQQIESYTSGTGTLVAWVNVPQVQSTSNTILYMYYGNPSTLTQENATYVWDSNYMGVWHLGEMVTDEWKNGTHYDSTSHHNNGAQNRSSYVTGKITGAQNFDNTLSPFDYISVPDDSSLDMPASQDFTVSAWVKTTDTGVSIPWPTIVRKVDDNTHNAGYSFVLHGVALGPIWYFENYQGGMQYAAKGVHDIADGTWHYIVGERQGANLVAYEDGNRTDTESGSAGDLSNTYPLRMGADDTSNPYEFIYIGYIDEVRVSKVARSSDWIATEYRNQNSPATFFSLAGEEPAPCAPTPITPPPPSNPTPNPPWFHCYWPYRKNITINSAQVIGTQASFTVLINLSDSNLMKAMSNGNDILFTTGDGKTAIPYERENFTQSTGTLTAWVNVPQIQSTSNTTIYMYYGNPSSFDMSRPSQAWDANYASIWHLTEKGTGTATDYKDSSNAGTNYGQGGGGQTSQVPNQSLGKIGFGQTFNYKTNNYIATTTQFTNPYNYTLSLWFRTTNTSYGKMLGFEDQRTGVTSTFYERQIYLGNKSPGVGGVVIGATSQASKYGFVNTTTGYNDGNWHFAVFTENDTPTATVQFFIDGALIGSNTSWVPSESASGYWRMGSYKLQNWPFTGSLSSFFNGTLDEARVSNAVRSASWVATEYNNTKSTPSTFFSVGPEESYVCGGAGPYYVQGASNSFGNVQQASITLPAPTTPGDLLILSFVLPSTRISNGPSDTKGNGYNIALTTTVGNYRLYTYSVPNALGGPGPITATVGLDNPATTLNITFLEYGGVATASPVDQSSSGSDTTTMAMNATLVTNTTKAQELLYGFGAGDYPCSATLSYNTRQSPTGGCAMDQTVSFTGIFNVTASMTSPGKWVLQMVTFKGA